MRQRLRDGAKAHVLEIGYGTGLNFLLSACAAFEGRGTLDYFAIDCRLIEVDVLAQLEYQQWLTPQNDGFYCDWLTWHQACENSVANLADCYWDWQIVSCGAQVSLRLLINDATLVDYADLESFDAIYLDAFSPHTSPALWTVNFFQRLSRCLNPGGLLVTYCVKSEVQRRLIEAGFDVQTKPGPAGGKREVLIAIKRKCYV